MNVARFTAATIYLAALAATAEPLALYDPNPQHPWNRVYDALYLRGLDSHRPELEALLGDTTPWDMLDPVLWPTTTYLLTEPSHSAAIALLDDAIAAQTATPVTGPRKRAVFQRDLWAVFDWAAEQAGRATGYDEQRATAATALMDRLAALMQQVALSEAELDALNADIVPTAIDGKAWIEPEFELGETASLEELYERFTASGDDFTAEPNWKRMLQNAYSMLRPSQRPEPPVRGEPGDDWVYVGLDGADTPLARGHTFAFHGRSVFSVVMRVPGGREATERYLREFGASLARIDRTKLRLPNSADENGRPVDPSELTAMDIPDLPPGTTLALLRRPITILSSGKPAPLPFLETVQFFEHGEQTFDHPLLEGRPWRTAAFGEFRLARDEFFAAGDGLVRVEEGNGDIHTIFQSHGIDWFERRNTEQPLRLSRALNCGSCHGVARDKSIHMTLSLYNFQLRNGEGPSAESLTSSLISSRTEDEAKAMSYAQTLSGWSALASRWDAQ